MSVDSGMDLEEELFPFVARDAHHDVHVDNIREGVASFGEPMDVIP